MVLSMDRRDFMRGVGSALGALASDLDVEERPEEEVSDTETDVISEIEDEKIEFFTYKSVNQEFLNQGDEAIGIRFGSRYDSDSVEIKLPYRVLRSQRPELAEDLKECSSFLSWADPSAPPPAEKVDILKDSVGLEGGNLALYLMDIEDKLIEKYESTYVSDSEKEVERKHVDGNAVLKIENLEFNPPHWFNYPFGSHQAETGAYSFDSFECHIGPENAYVHFYEGEEPEEVLEPETFDRVHNHEISKRKLEKEEEILYELFK